MMRIKITILLLGTLLVFCVGAGWAQEITGSIHGTVTDATGALVPGATVVIRHLQTGTERSLTTNQEGLYVATQLPIGTYLVSVEAPGFRKFEKRDIILHVNDRLTVDARLEIGAVTEVVTVTESPTVVQEVPVIQSLISGQQVRELPLNNRNFVQLATLVPGVTDSLPDEVGIGLTSLISVSINGLRRNAVNWMVDGVTNVDVGSNITLLSTPTVDSIAEFKILTSTYSAEWGRSGGGVVNVVTRGGGRDFHGSGYEFLRNDALNANRFFSNRANLPTPRLRYNNFGYTFSGPVYIPGRYNVGRTKTFFFWSQEWRRISRAVSNVTGTVPSGAFRNGNFSSLNANPTACTQSGAVCDPTTGRPFAGNQIPAARIDANAKAFLAGELWPLPNTGTNQFLSQARNINNTRQETLRIDHWFSERWQLSGRFTNDLSTTIEPGGLFVGIVIPNIATTRTPVPGRILRIALTAMYNPTTTNELSLNISGNKITTTLLGRGRRSDYSGLSIPELFAANPGDLIPNISVTGFSGLTVRPEFRIVYWAGALRDNFSKLVRRHFFKAGFEITSERKSENSSGRPHGAFAFNGTRTSGGRSSGLVPFADFLLGLASSYTEAEREIVNHLRFNRYEFYVQDTWKARPNFTLDLGVRYALFPPVIDRDNVLTSFFVGFYNRTQAPQFANTAGTLLTAGTGNLLNGIAIAGVNSPFGRRIYPTDKNNWGPRVGFAWNPFSDQKTVVRGGYGLYYDQPLVGIFEQNAFVNPPFNREVTFVNVSFAAPSGGAAGALGVPGLIATSADFTTPISQQWSFGVQRQLHRKALLEVSYSGSKGDHLIRPVDINQPQPQDVLTLSGPPPAATRANRVRPFPGYGAITQRETSAESRYHGLLSNFRLEGMRGLMMNIAYTWSKNITDATNDRDAIDVPQNPLDFRSERAIARSDRTHVFTASYIWDLPFLKTHTNPVIKHTLAGWQFSGITTFQSGLPIPRIVQDTLGSRRGNRANVIGDPGQNLPPGLFHFNPAAFANPALGTYGNSGRAIIRGPGRNQWDFALSKNWRFRESGRLQFRADFFNAFNHTQFSSVQASRDATTIGQYTDTRFSREIQFALKIEF